MRVESGAASLPKQLVLAVRSLPLGANVVLAEYLLERDVTFQQLHALREEVRRPSLHWK
jgi:hypothetical protein